MHYQNDICFQNWMVGGKNSVAGVAKLLKSDLEHVLKSYILDHVE